MKFIMSTAIALAILWVVDAAFFHGRYTAFAHVMINKGWSSVFH
jgi:hypothetical protein